MSKNKKKFNRTVARIGSNETPEELSLSGQELDVAEAQILAEALKKNRHLILLNLSNNLCVL